MSHDINDDENTNVLVFVGTSGHEKSTQINAFISYHLGGDLTDKFRVMVINDSEKIVRKLYSNSSFS